MGEVIRINEAKIRDHLGEMVRGAVEETLNTMGTAVQDLKENFFATRVFESEKLKTKVNGDRDEFTRQSERIGALALGNWASTRTAQKLEKTPDQ